MDTTSLQKRAVSSATRNRTHETHLDWYMESTIQHPKNYSKIHIVHIHIIHSHNTTRVTLSPLLSITHSSSSTPTSHHWLFHAFHTRLAASLTVCSALPIFLPTFFRLFLSWSLFLL